MILSPIALALAHLLSPSAQSEAAAAPAAPTAVDSHSARLQRARALASAGEREQALALYSQMLDESPRDVDARLARGRTYAWMHHWPEAEADLRGSVEQSPDYADAWSALGDM
ncbi:MAG: tetratricopeptide repeat protein, partial [Pseudomonadota bacterium]|nr:tetratricopeptide repeat protein [Pseudomonadota bacterium]